MIKVLPRALIGGFVVAGCLASQAQAGDAVSTALDNAGYALVATFTVKADKQQEFAAAMSQNIEASRKEAGVLLYRSYHSASDPLKYVNVELYKDKAAFDSHLASDHVKIFSAKAKSILSGEIEVVPLSSLQ